MSLDLFESETMPFLETAEQTHLTQRVQTAMAEAQTAATLLKATDGQVGVDPAQVMAWHQLVAECWAVVRRYRAQIGSGEGKPTDS